MSMPQHKPNGWYSAEKHPAKKHLMVLSDGAADIRLTANARYLCSEMRNNEADPEHRWLMTVWLRDDPSQYAVGQARTWEAAYENAVAKLNS